MSTKKDTTDSSLEMTSEPKKRPESKYNASILRECIKEGLDAKSIMEEISLTPDPGTRNDLLGYVREIIEIGTEQSVLGDNLGKRLADALPVAALPDRSDRELIGNAIGLNCDAFCTCDHRTIIAKRHLLPKMELKILTPVEWWAHIKPWAALWC